MKYKMASSEDFQIQTKNGGTLEMPDVPNNETRTAATINDATLNEVWAPVFSLTEEQKQYFSEIDGASDNDYALTIHPDTNGKYTLYVGSYNAATFYKNPNNENQLLFENGHTNLNLIIDSLVATLVGYTLGTQSDSKLCPMTNINQESAIPEVLTQQQMNNVVIKIWKALGGQIQQEA